MAEAVSSTAESDEPQRRAETSSLSLPLPSPSSQAPDSASVVVHGSAPKEASIQDTSTSSIEETLALLSIDHVSPKAMFWSLYSVFQNAYEKEGSIDLDQNEMESLRSRLHRAQFLDDQHGIRVGDDLVACKEVMEQMLKNRSKFLSNAVQILLRASRHPDWRYAFGHAGILSFLLQVVVTDTASDVLLELVIRTIGNTCIENDLNRQIVVDNNGLEGIIRQLNNIFVKVLVIPVLHNICDDSLPAQKLAVANGLYPKLVKLLSESLMAPNPYFEYLCRLLELLTGSFDAETTSDGTMEVLFQAVLQQTLEFKDFSSLSNVIIALLQAKRNQLYIIDKDIVQLALDLLHQSYYPPISASSPTSLPTEEELELISMRRGLVTVLADIGYLPEFVTKYGRLDSPVIDTLLSWLPTQHEELQTCSCIMLGNMAQSRSTCRVMADRHRLHVILLNVVKTSYHHSVLFPALGFLANLAWLPDVKEVLGDLGVISEVARFWKAPPLDQVSVRLTRCALKESINNVSRLLSPFLGPEGTPGNNLREVNSHTFNLASIPATENDHEKTYLSLLLSAFDESDSSGLKFEVANIVHAIFWTIYNSGVATSPDSTKDLLFRIYRHHPNVAKPLGLMVQNGNPEIRSRGWFAMALMARTNEGAVALGFLLTDKEVFEALQATVRGRPTSLHTQATLATTESGPDAADSASSEAGLRVESDAMMKLGICRDNAMVMVHEILKNESGTLGDRRGELEELLQHMVQTYTAVPDADG